MNKTITAKEKGTYILILFMDRETSITIGSLGEQIVPRGYYLYIGSALGGLVPRLRRHLRREKKIRWHIDYLLLHARVQEVWWHCGRDRLECSWALDLFARFGGKGVSRFGSSDCRCPTHLIYTGARKPSPILRRKLEGAPLGCLTVRHFLHQVRVSSNIEPIAPGKDGFRR